MLQWQYQPFDVVLFSGKGLVSRVIQLGTGSEWSHVALVVPDSTQEDGVALLESTTLSDVPCLDAGVPMKGVMRVPIEERVSTYDGKIAVRSIEGPVSPAQVLQCAIEEKTYMGRPYEENQLELASSALDATGLLTNQEDMSSVFCSELTATVLIACNILSKDRATNEYTPADFSLEDGNVQLRDGYSWGEQVVVKEEKQLSFLQRLLS